VPERGGFHVSGSGGRGIELARLVVHAKQGGGATACNPGESTERDSAGDGETRGGVLPLLAQNSRYVDPDWLFDSMAVAGSFRSSFNDDHHHTIDDATTASKISSSREEDVVGDEDEDVFSVVRPRKVVPTRVDLISSIEREREKESLVSLFV
jgi:hypothetical protein